MHDVGIVMFLTMLPRVSAVNLSCMALLWQEDV